MSIIKRAMAGAAGVASQGLMQSHQAQLQGQRDEKQFDFEREKADILARNQENLERIRAQTRKNSGTSSTLAELNHLNLIADPEQREAEERRMLNLKRAGFSHGEERFDASGSRIVDAGTTATNKAEVAGAVEEAKLSSQLDQKPKIAQAEQNAKNAAISAKEAFDELGEVRANLVNIDDAIAALDDGAGTGAVEKYLPSIKSASIRLQNIKAKLGLDELAKFKGSTTERELNISLDTALLDNLSEPELRKWLVQSRDRKIRAIDTLTRAAKFLESNTLGDWLTEREVAPEGSVRAAPAGVSEEDIIFTMKKHGVSREDVLNRIGGN